MTLIFSGFSYPSLYIADLGGRGLGNGIATLYLVFSVDSASKILNYSLI